MISGCSTCCISWNVPQRSVEPCQVAAKQICGEIYWASQVPRSCSPTAHHSTGLQRHGADPQAQVRKILKYSHVKLIKTDTRVDGCSVLTLQLRTSIYNFDSGKAAFTPFYDMLYRRTTDAVFGRNVELFTISVSPPDFNSRCKLLNYR